MIRLRSIISQHLNTKAAMKDGCMYPFMMFSVYQGEDVSCIPHTNTSYSNACWSSTSWRMWCWIVSKITSLVLITSQWSSVSWKVSNTMSCSSNSPMIDRSPTMLASLFREILSSRSSIWLSMRSSTWTWRTRGSIIRTITIFQRKRPMQRMIYMWKLASTLKWSWMITCFPRNR